MPSLDSLYVQSLPQSSAQLAGAISDETGTGVVVYSNGGTLVSPNITNANLTTPILGTPSSGNLSNCTGYSVNDLTGLATGMSSFLTSPTSANLASTVTNETGTGSLVFGSSPNLTNPTINGLTATGTVTLPTTTSIGNVSSTELGFLDGVTSSIQTQLNSKLSQSDTLSLFNATGSAPVYACRAWVCFDGSPITIRNSGNVSSITGLGVGHYQINFTTNMSDANYAAVFGVTSLAVIPNNSTNIAETARTSSSITIRTWDDEADSNVDGNFISVVIFR